MSTDAVSPLRQWRVKLSQTSQEKNKALVLEAYETLFNKRAYVAAEGFWSTNYIQHSAHIAPGRAFLFNLVKSLPQRLRYEPGVIVGSLEPSPGACAGGFWPGGRYIAGKKVRFHYFCVDLPHSDGCFVKAYPAEMAGATADFR
jgi:hypothetical protein